MSELMLKRLSSFVKNGKNVNTVSYDLISGYVDRENVTVTACYEHSGIYELTHSDGVTTIIHTSDGNKKLVPNKKINFLIFNLLAYETCPGRTEQCGGSDCENGRDGICYAFKAEDVYPECKPARRENYFATISPYFVIDMVYIITRRVKNMRKEKLVTRLHESGDFYSAVYAAKWLEVARRISKIDFGKKSVKMMAYTKSFPFFDGVVIPEIFKLRASIMDDTPEFMKEIIRRNGWDTYTAVDKFDGKGTYTECPCKDCADCEQCWSDFSDIRCEKH